MAELRSTHAAPIAFAFALVLIFAAPTAAQPARAKTPDPILSPVSAAALHDYVTKIQPLLLNRCANAACHGRASTNRFVLNDPPRRSMHSRKVTEQNVAATMAWLSPPGTRQRNLLDWASVAHGSAAKPALDERQLLALRTWVQSVADDGPGMGHDPTLGRGQQESAVTQPMDAASTVSQSLDPFDPAVFNRQKRGDDDN